MPPPECGWPDELEPGYYWIDSDYGIRLGPFSLGKTIIMRSKKVQRLLKEKKITRRNIKGILVPSYSYSNDKMRDFIKYVFSLDVEPRVKKTMINSFIGMLGKNKGTKVSHSFTNSESIAMALFVDGKIRNYNYSNESNLILMKDEREYEIHENYRNIFHDLLVHTILNLYDMFKIATGGNEESWYRSYGTELNPKAPTLIAYKTDSITVANALDVPLSTEIGGYKLEKVKLGEKKVKNTILSPRSDIIYYHWVNSKKFSGYGSYLITGKAGRGKTYVIANEVIPKLNELKEQWFALGFSHQVKNNLNSYPIMENRAMTIASFFENAQKCPGIFWNNIKTKINNRTWIIVDEIFAVSKEYICDYSMKPNADSCL